MGRDAGLKRFQQRAFSAEGGEIRRRAAECAEYFGISAIFERDTASLSGGEKQLLSVIKPPAGSKKFTLAIAGVSSFG